MLIPLRTLISLSTLLMLNPAWSAGDPPEIPLISEFQIRYLDVSQADVAVSGAQRAMEMSARVGENLAHVSAGKGAGQVLRINRKLTRAQAWELATRMVQQGGVMYAEPIDPSFNPLDPLDPEFNRRPPIETSGKE